MISAVSLAIEKIDDPAKPVRYVAGEIIAYLMTKGPKPEAARKAVENLAPKMKAMAEEIIGKVKAGQSDKTTAPVAKSAPSTNQAAANTGVKPSSKSSNP